jgi:hypothetical protein
MGQRISGVQDDAKTPSPARISVQYAGKSGGGTPSGVQKCQRPRRETGERIKAARTSGALNLSRYLLVVVPATERGCNIADMI